MAKAKAAPAFKMHAFKKSPKLSAKIGKTGRIMGNKKGASTKTNSGKPPMKALNQKGMKRPTKVQGANKRGKKMNYDQTRKAVFGLPK